MKSTAAVRAAKRKGEKRKLTKHTRSNRLLEGLVMHRQHQMK
jgi:hypothetical protein